MRIHVLKKQIANVNIGLLEKGTNKIIAACQNDFEKRFPDDIENFVSAEYCEDGTIIRLYNHNGIWKTCTKKCINAKTSHWSHVKSFNDMFWEVFNNSHFNICQLDKDCTYIFALLHVDNLLIVKHQKNELVYIGRIHNAHGEYLGNDDFDMFGVNKNIKLPQKVNITPQMLVMFKEYYSYTISKNHMKKNITKILTNNENNEELTKQQDNEELTQQQDNENNNENNNALQTNPLCQFFDSTKRGIIFKFTDNRIYKADFDEFIFLQNIRGNEPLIRNRYLELLNDEESLKLLIMYYHEHHFTFSMIKHNILVVCNDIYMLYRKTHIKHLTVIDETHLYYRTLKQLHGQYKKTNIPITTLDVYNKLKSYNMFVLKKLLRWAV